MDKQGHQTIGCGVKSCCYNSNQRCTLDRIDVEPTENCNSGKACDESMCASYCCKSGK